MYLYTYFSLIFIILSLFLYKKVHFHYSKAIFVWCILFVHIILYISYFATNALTGNGIDESVLYHIQYGLEGAGIMEYQYIAWYSLIALILFIILWWREFNICRKR